MKIEKIKDLPQEYVDDWARISRELTLSEDFIRDHQDKVDWEYISKYQKLSEDFIKEFSLVIPKYNILNIVHYCGKLNRVIYILKEDPNRIHIGCGKFTKEEAIAAINKKYSGKEQQEYINKVNECFNF